MDKKITIKDLFNNIDIYSEEADLYLPSDQNWHPDTLCEFVSDAHNNAQHISINGSEYQYILGLYNIEDIIDNLNAQKKHPNIEDFIKALKFYFNNDAFIELGD